MPTAKELIQGFPEPYSDSDDEEFDNSKFYSGSNIFKKINAKTVNNEYLSMEKNICSIIKCQSIFRGKNFRKKNMPNSLLTIKQTLLKHRIKISKTTEDGRINSCIDEEHIINILSHILPDRIYKPKARMWYDILVFDYLYGWLPINIKTTTTLTCDNTGNLAMCVHAYTDTLLDLKKTYQNGKMSQILIDKLNKKQYNFQDKKDYYFVVLNKNNNNDIIINSIKGLTEITPNINNLPFQVRWSKNKHFNYKNIYTNIKLFIHALQKPTPSWKETFINHIRYFSL